MLNRLHNITLNLLLIVHSLLGFNQNPNQILLHEEVNNKILKNINNATTKDSSKYSTSAAEDNSLQLTTARPMQFIDYMHNFKNVQSLKTSVMRVLKEYRLKFASNKGYTFRNRSLHNARKSIKYNMEQMRESGNKKKPKHSKINLLQIAASIVFTPAILMGIFLPFILPALKMATFASMVMNNAAFIGALMYAIRSYQASNQPELHINYAST